jgi:broad specificity phosphatase PhoE
VGMFDKYVRTPGQAEPGSETDARARKLVDAFEALLPATATLVAHHFTRVLLATALEHIEHVGSPSELQAVKSAASGGTS